MPKVYRSDLNDVYDVTQEEFDTLFTYTDEQGNLVEIQGGLSAVGYTTDHKSLGKNEDGTADTSSSSGSSGGTDGGIDYSYALSVANTLYGFLPESIVKKFAEGYAEYGGDDTLALAYTRRSAEYKAEFGWLFNDDGITLKMSEIEAVGVMESYKNTLKELGIQDFEDFDEDFKGMVGNVAPIEFQQRIDAVYDAINNRIPEVRTLLADYLGTELDDATIFASLINPKIEDKVLLGAIDTVTIGAEAASRGYTYSFAKFNRLKQQGMDLKTARQLYENAGSFISSATAIGRDLNISTLEQAALGDSAAVKTVSRITAEMASAQGRSLGAAKEGDELVGLIED